MATKGAIPSTRDKEAVPQAPQSPESNSHQEDDHDRDVLCRDEPSRHNAKESRQRARRKVDPARNDAEAFSDGEDTEAGEVNAKVLKLRNARHEVVDGRKYPKCHKDGEDYTDLRHVNETPSQV